jgi:uncharacterized protein (TIGR01777 family)
MNFLVTGGTGFIGSRLVQRLLTDGHNVAVLTRNRHKASQKFPGSVRTVESLEELRSIPDVIVNLAGITPGSRRWTAKFKQKLIESRVQTTNRLVEYIASSSIKPRVLISGSAVGYYGAHRDTALDESDAWGKEFQSLLCKSWEDAGIKAERFGGRVCLLRMGVVLGTGGGALKGLLPLFKLGLGAYLGDGRQWISWIHIQDLMEIILHLAAHETLVGAFNATAPNPETNRNLAMKLGAVLGRPVILRIPGWMVRVKMGEVAHLFLTGQRVLPTRLLESGYTFRYPELTSALSQIVKEK